MTEPATVGRLNQASAPRRLASPAGPDQILGTWFTPNGASKVETVKCGKLYCVNIVRLQTPKSNLNNADPTLKGRPLLNAQIVTRTRVK